MQTQSHAQADHTPDIGQSGALADGTSTADRQASVLLPTRDATEASTRQDTQTVPVAPASVTASTATVPNIEPSPIPVPPDDSVIATTQTASVTAASPTAIADNEHNQLPARSNLELLQESAAQQAESESYAIEPPLTPQEAPVNENNAQDAQLDGTAQAVTEQSAETSTGFSANADQSIRNTNQNIQTPSSAPMNPSEMHTVVDTVTEQESLATENVPSTQAAVEGANERTWNAVNTSVDIGEAAAATTMPRKPTGRRRRKAVTLQNMDKEEAEEARLQETADADDDFAPPRSQRPSAKPRGKRKVAARSAGEEDGAAQPPAKRIRQPRKAKAKGPSPAGSGQSAEPSVENENGQGADNVQSVERRDSAEDGESSRAPNRPTPSRKRKRQSTSQPDGNGEGEQPRRKGRPPRAPTPSDAEDEVIDEDHFFMDDLARRNIRIGKLSQREKKMREINWEEVKQRQKEKEAEQMNSRAVHAEMERQAQERENAVRTVQEQVRYENVGGEMRIVQGSGQVNYEEIAETRYAEEVVEEDDFTNRITSRSFMRNNKRYPEEFLLPGQGKRWDIRSTQDFYDALRMFGTDFGMMTTLFEGVSRRSLKLKFNREERKNSEVIKEILQQKDTRLQNWDEFLKASGKEQEQYDRVEQIKLDLAAAEEDARRQIEEAKAEYEEEKRQKRLAGFMSDEEGGENDASKKKKGKKGKDKHVTFQQQDEEGVEILEVDENDGWGED